MINVLRSSSVNSTSLTLSSDPNPNPNPGLVRAVILRNELFYQRAQPIGVIQFQSQLCRLELVLIDVRVRKL